MDIDEGTLQDDFGGRRWGVTVQEGQQVRQAFRQQRQTRKDTEEDGRVLTALDQLDKAGAGASYTRVRGLARLNNDAMTRVVARLVAQGTIEEIPIEVTKGRGARHTSQGLRRRSPQPVEALGQGNGVSKNDLSGGSTGSTGLFDHQPDVPMIGSTGSSGQTAPPIGGGPDDTRPDAVIYPQKAANGASREADGTDAGGTPGGTEPLPDAKTMAEIRAFLDEIDRQNGLSA